jgi:viologen exporter family transport system ATP-binding protein
MIRVEGLNKSFRIKQKAAGFKGGLTSLVNPQFKQVDAVRDIAFHVQAGDMLAFIGPNGAGKSTTIKMMTGILYPTSGSISCLGMDPQKDRKRLAYHVGSVFGQKPQLWYHLPPIDTYQLLYRIYELDREKFTKRLDMLVEKFEIGDLLTTPVRKLSLGQRMRCEITASLLHQPKVIFLDEPTIGLDVVAKLQIREVIRELNEKEGVTIFLTSHDAGDIESLAKRTIVINHGTIVFDDTTKKFKQNYITTKTVEITVDGAMDTFNANIGRVVEQTKHRIKIELDQTQDSIERLLNYAIENFTITDINIFEPPMEEIISSIYRERAA